MADTAKASIKHSRTAKFLSRLSCCRTAVTMADLPPVRLSWSELLPPVDFMFSVDRTDIYYQLFDECLQHLRNTISPSSLTSDMLLMGQMGSLHQWPSSFGILVNALSDRYCPDINGEREFLHTPCLTNVLDFLVVGVQFLAESKRSLSDDRPRSADSEPLLDVLGALQARREQLDLSTSSHLLYHAAFLVLVTSFWATECKTRSFSHWSPMPWSRTSRAMSTGVEGEGEFPLGITVDDFEPTRLDDMDDHEFRRCNSLRTTVGQPADVPYSGLRSSHDGHPFCPNVPAYVKRRREGRLTSTLHDDAALWLDAMTFGVFEAVLGVRITEISLLARSDDSECFLSGMLLSRLILKWFIHMASTFELPGYDRNNDAHLRRGREIAATLRWAFAAVDEECREDFSLFSRAGFDMDTVQDVVSSVAIATNVLCTSAVCLWPQLPELIALTRVIEDSTRYSYVIMDASCRRRLVKKGWCPNSVSQLFALERRTLSNLLWLEPIIRDSIDEHHGCTAEACALYTVADTDGYEAKHVLECPLATCRLICPPQGEVEDILSRGLVPVIINAGTRLVVRSASDGPYVAISHVWADGLGSTTEKGLPACQVARLTSLVQGMLPESGAFWIDSLCVPERKDLRTSAIKLMARTYSEASKVLVVDTTLRMHSHKRATWDETILRISTSGWVRRVWTLQEGLLARKLFFEFADGIVDSEALQHAAAEQLGQIVHSDYYRRHLPLLAYRADTHTQRYTLDDVTTLMRNRTTSKLEDETIAIAHLLPVDVGVLLDITDENAAERRMVAFLLQLKEVPRRFALIGPIRRLSLPRFRWAPRTLAGALETSSGANGSGLGTCTVDGLLADYELGRFEVPAILPPAYAEGSTKPWLFFITYHTTRSTYKVILHPTLRIADDPTQITSLLFTNEVLPVHDAQFILCAAVHDLGTFPDSGGTIRCRFVSSGLLQRMTYDPVDMEAMCLPQKPHERGLFTMGALVNAKVLLH